MVFIVFLDRIDLSGKGRGEELHFVRRRTAEEGLKRQ